MRFPQRREAADTVVPPGLPQSGGMGDRGDLHGGTIGQRGTIRFHSAETHDVADCARRYFGESQNSAAPADGQFDRRRCASPVADVREARQLSTAEPLCAA